jgi:Ser/Thr protein kinase RdoA (MazF antagonist)
MTQSLQEQGIHDCLLENYGISGVLKRLPGENLNLLMTIPEGQRCIVKIVGDEMPAEVVEMESQAMKHAKSAGFSLELPQIRKNNNKKIETRINIHINGLNRLRIIECIDGNLLEYSSDISDRFRRQL